MRLDRIKDEEISVLILFFSFDNSSWSFMDSKLEILCMYTIFVDINNFRNVLVVFFYINKPKFSKDKKKVIKTIDIFVQFLRSCYCNNSICDYQDIEVSFTPNSANFQNYSNEKKAISVYILIFSVELMAAVSSTCTSYVTLLYLIWIALTLHAKFTPF